MMVDYADEPVANETIDEPVPDSSRTPGYIKQRMSTRTINYLKIDESSPVFYGEDPELVDITLRNIRNTDKNNDGGLDIEEVASAVLNAAKDSRKAQKKEKNLKRVALGLSGFLCIFAVIFLITQATHLSNSIEEAKVTSVSSDTYGHKHLQGKNGGDLSTRSFGDEFVAENKLDLYSGRVLQCVPTTDLAFMSYDTTHGVDASVVVLDTKTGLPAVGVPLSGKFEDTHDVLHFGNDNVKAIMDSDACNLASSSVAVEESSNEDDEQDNSNSLERHLAKHSSSPLARNRALYEIAVSSIREGRTLEESGSVVVEMPYTASMCEVLPSDNTMVKENTDSIACPALRFLVKTALQDGLFDICGYDTDDYIVDTASMKSLLTVGKGSFSPGFERDKIITAPSLSVFDRVFSGAIDGQAVGVLKHSDSSKCIENSSTGLVLDSTCTGISQLWKLLPSSDDESKKIHFRSDQTKCISLNSAENGVELTDCTLDLAKWKLDSGRIKKFGGSLCLDVDASNNIIVQSCSSSASQVWVPPPMINMADIQLSFDHSASSGIIGKSTLFNSADSDSFNQDKYDEFLRKLCDCSDLSALDSSTTFTEADFGRAVNHFGSQLDVTRTKVGPFSWGVLGVEHTNLFTVFKVNGVFPLTTFQALFLPEEQLINLQLLNADTLDTIFVPQVQRDALTDDIQLSEVFEAFGLEISCDVKAAMDEAVDTCDCGNNPDCGACGMSELFVDLCGEGYINCVASGC